MTPQPVSDPAPYPLVFHNNGGAFFRGRRNPGAALARALERRLFSNPPAEPRPQPENLEIVICHNFDAPQLVERSLAHVGATRVTRLGRGVADWRNSMKTELVLRRLEASDAEFALYLDSNDILVRGAPGTLLERFLAANDCEILFAAERTAWPSTEDDLAEFGIKVDPAAMRGVEAFEAGAYPAPFCHLNAGCYIGRRAAIVETLKAALELARELDEHTSDQCVLRLIHRRLHPRIKIDARCALFQCLFMLRPEELRLERPLGAVERGRAELEQRFLRMARKAAGLGRGR